MRVQGQWFVTCGYNLFSAGLSTSVLVDYHLPSHILMKSCGIRASNNNNVLLVPAGRGLTFTDLPHLTLKLRTVLLCQDSSLPPLLC